MGEGSLATSIAINNLIGRVKDMDETENIRRQMVTEINAEPNERQALEHEHGKVWDTSELQKDFEVLGFMAPFVIVQEKATGRKGTLMFQGGQGNETSNVARTR
jgi:hypothetical protein